MGDPFDPYDMFGGGVRTRPPRRAAPPPTTRPPARPPRPAVSYRRPQPPPRRRSPARQHQIRHRLLLVAVIGLFAAVVGRLAYLQVVDGDRLEQLGQQQVVRTIDLPGDRGSILDRNGDELALSLPRPTVYADPRFVEDPDEAAALLAPVLGVDAAVLEDRLSGDGAFAYLARQVDPAVADRVEELDIPGVALLDEAARFLPAGDLGRSVVGSVDVDGVGTAGIELLYDEVLAGEPGQLILERDPNGRTIPQGERQVEPAVPGDDVLLTIDRGMQHATEQALVAQVEATGALGGRAVVMNPRTGDVYALANVGRPEEGGPPQPIGANRVLTAVFEPGSVNKIITVAAALEEGVVAPTTYLTVPDSVQVADHRFRDHDPHPTASWTPTDIVSTSSNVGTILLAQQLGRERVDEYLRRFGFGEPTAIGFPGESGGLLLDVDDWSGTSIGSIPLGQGVAVTAMQMLAAYNVIANGGEYVAPRLVAGTIDPEGNRHEATSPAPRRVVSEQTAAAVRDMLVAVVEHGTGTAAAIEGYAVAGKTGTARIPQVEHMPDDAYMDLAGNYHYEATFAGFLPAEDPQLSIIVVIDEPSNGYYASQVAAPVFAEIARFALRQFRIPPSGTEYRSTVPPPTATAPE